MWDPTSRLYSLYSSQVISIHGSRVGPDRFSETCPKGLKLFQSTGPVWDPTQAITKVSKALTISIHGSRVGPDILFIILFFAFLISIHGSRVGPDVNPLGKITVDYAISIHGSRVGPDGISSARAMSTGISIHGSRVGPDDSVTARREYRIYFNPRVPCGTRHPSQIYF